MHSAGTCWRFAALMIVAVGNIFAAGASPPPLRQQLADDLSDGALNQLSLFEAAIIAGGVEDLQYLQKLSARIEWVCQSVTSQVKALSNPADRLNAIHACLHRELLLGTYRAECTELHRTLESGDFNCVSATILFRCLCQRCGVHCHAIAARDHVLCRQAGPEPLLIETTCRDSFAAGMSQQPERIRASLDGEEFRELSDVQLIGKIYYNRGVVCLEARRFAAAVPLLQCAWRLDDQDHSARENILAALNNWALDECACGHFRAASELLAEARAISPDYPPLQTNDLHLHQRWVRQLCDEQCFAEAVELLKAAQQRRPDVELFSLGQSSVYSLWAQSRFFAGDLEAGWQLLGQASREGNVSSAEDAGAETAVCNACRQLIERGHLDTATLLISEALKQWGASDELLRVERDLLQARLQAK